MAINRWILEYFYVLNGILQQLVFNSSSRKMAQRRSVVTK